MVSFNGLAWGCRTCHGVSQKISTPFPSGSLKYTDHALPCVIGFSSLARPSFSSRSAISRTSAREPVRNAMWLIVLGGASPWRTGRKAS